MQPGGRYGFAIGAEADRDFTGQQAGPEVERDVGHGAQPEADPRADDEGGQDEYELVQSGKRTEHL